MDWLIELAGHDQTKVWIYGGIIGIWIAAILYILYDRLKDHFKFKWKIPVGIGELELESNRRPMATLVWRVSALGRNGKEFNGHIQIGVQNKGEVELEQLVVELDGIKISKLTSRAFSHVRQAGKERFQFSSTIWTNDTIEMADLQFKTSKAPYSISWEMKAKELQQKGILEISTDELVKACEQF